MDKKYKLIEIMQDPNLRSKKCRPAEFITTCPTFAEPSKWLTNFHHYDSVNERLYNEDFLLEPERIEPVTFNAKVQYSPSSCVGLLDSYYIRSDELKEFNGKVIKVTIEEV